MEIRSVINRIGLGFSQVIVVAVAAICVSPQASSMEVTTGHESLPGTIFVPGDYVPLSEFKNRTIGGPLNTTVFHVDSGVLEWIALEGGQVRVAFLNAAGNLSAVLNGVTVQASEGLVEYAGNKTGKGVVVSGKLKHDVEIVTNWSFAQDVRGNQVSGGMDGIGLLGFDPGTGQIFEAGESIKANQIIPHEISVTQGGLQKTYKYYYNTPHGTVAAPAGFNLFSDGSNEVEVEGALVPAFERYVAENYSRNKVTKLRAIWFSDKTRKETGFPLAHRNHPYAFSNADPTASGAAGSVSHPSCTGEPSCRFEVQDDLPVLQAVHCHIVDIDEAGEQYPLIAGAENSLVTFLLPPTWTSASPSGTYPILLNGSYDIHDSTFASGEATFVKWILGAITSVYRADTSRRAIGILWNGGGSNATSTVQPSAYKNVEKLAKDAEELLRADPDRIVMAGSSRGGVTTLTMASNPDSLAYTVKYADATNCNTRFGEAIVYASPTYPHGFEASDTITGYQDSWRSDFIDPGTGRDSHSQSLHTLFGITDPAMVDELYSIDSPRLREGLQSQQTQVVFRNSTHDYTRSYAQVLDYVHNLRGMLPEIPLVFQVYYQGGHSQHFSSTIDIEDLLNNVFESLLPTLVSGTEHFKQDPTDPKSWDSIGNPDSNSDDSVYQPFVFEGPHSVQANQPFTWVFSGQMGSRIQLWMAELGQGWNPAPLMTCGSIPSMNLQKVFDTQASMPLIGGSGDQIGSRALHNIAFPWNSDTRYWWYEVKYNPNPFDPNSSLETYGRGYMALQSTNANGCPDPVTFVVELPSQSGSNPYPAGEVLGKISGEALTGGLSTEADI